MKKRKSFFKKKSFISRIIQKTKFFLAKFNFFDYLVVFLLFLVLSFFIYNRLQRQVVWTNVRIAVENVDWWYGSGAHPRYWYADDLQVGDQAKDSFGQIVAEVISVDNYDQGGPYRMIFVDLKVKVDFDKNKNQYLYEFKPLVIGSSLVINFPKNQLRGVVVQTGQKETEYYFKTIRVSNKKIHNFVAEQIRVGDKAYDSEGKLVAEVLDFKRTNSSSYEYSDIRGQKIQVIDPDYSDLDIVLKVKAFNILDRNFYINDTVLKVGSNIWIQFENYAIDGDARISQLID